MGGTCNVQFTPLWIRFFQCRSARYLGCIGLVKSLVFGAVCFDMLFSCDVHRAVWSRDDGLNFPASRDFCNFSLLFLSTVLQGSYVSCPPARKGRMKWGMIYGFRGMSWPCSEGQKSRLGDADSVV